jgi:hypothetical protein
MLIQGWVGVPEDNTAAEKHQPFRKTINTLSSKRSILTLTAGGFEHSVTLGKMLMYARQAPMNGETNIVGFPWKQDGLWSFLQTIPDGS